MRKRESQIVVAGVCALLGFLLAYQFKMLNKDTNQQKYSTDILEEINILKKEKEELLASNNSLSEEIKKLEEAAAKEGELELEIKKQLDSARMRLGLVDVKGPGLEINIIPKTSIFNNNSGDISKDLGENEIVYLINMLWYAKSEAISINGIRVTPQMGIKNSSNYISLGSAGKLSAKEVMQIKVIGDKGALKAALEFPYALSFGALPNYKIEIKESDEIIIEKSTQSPTNNYITPVEQEE